ncbi:uncharacterized protein LOC143185179 isoform X2 [Calliopsis andreniformis]
MSWLFGRKKHQKDSPPSESVEEENSSDQNEGFVVVKGPAPVPPSVGQDASGYPSGNLYPYIPTVIPSDSSKDHSHGDTMHYLSGVPFKLCKQLEINMNNDLVIDRLRIDEILSFVERIQSQNYDYNFSLEESVIAEMNSGSSE